MTRNRRRALALLVASALLLLVGWLGHVLAWPIAQTLLGMLAGLGAGGLLLALLLWWSPDICESTQPALQRRYLREFMPAMLGYVLALFLSMWLLRTFELPDALRALVALLPVPPIAFAVRAIIRYIRDTDELQRRIELEALSIATAGVSLGYLSAGLLQAAKVIDVPASAAMIWVFPLVCLVYGVAKVVIARRYS